MPWWIHTCSMCLSVKGVLALLAFNAFKTLDTPPQRLFLSSKRAPSHVTSAAGLQQHQPTTVTRRLDTRTSNLPNVLIPSPVCTGLPLRPVVPLKWPAYLPT